MILGQVTADFDPVVLLTLQATDGTTCEVPVVVDTGFNGLLTLPPDLIAQLGFPWRGVDSATLADGRTVLFDIHAGVIHWQGSLRKITVDASESQPLLGMQLLENHHLGIEVVADGSVQIRPM